MLLSANGPIEMVVTVPSGSNAIVLVQDFGFGRGYDISIVESDELDADALAVVALLAPATHPSLPVTVYGTRLSLGLPLLNGWSGGASGTANEWITFEIQ
jgi:hypothetical protein